jgi:S-DNA-T family DNA segregation ATPase FtsK/SpoIIIE
VWFNRGDPVECQVIYPDGTVASSASSPAPKKAHRIARLPRHISVDDLPRTRNRHRVALGIGGHDASHQYLNLTRGALVVGPRGSGKTCTLRSILRRLPPSADAFVVAQDPELLAEAQRCRIPHGGAAEAAISCASLTIVDDAHRVQHLEPAGMDDLAAAAVRGETRVIASTLPAEAVMAVHGMVAHLASRGTGVILHPHERGSAEIFGTPVEDVIDAYPPPPGRAALVHRRKAEPIQLADPR